MLRAGRRKTERLRPVGPRTSPGEHRNGRGSYGETPMPDFSKLLEVQHHDTLLSQLHHRRGHLPEHDRVMTLEAARAAVLEDRAPSSILESALSTRQSSLEAQIADVDIKIAGADRALYGGTVTATRELQALEADLASLRRRRNELEDLELEVLVEREPIDALLATSAAKLSALDAELDEARLAAVAAAAAIDASAVAERHARDDAASAVDASLLGRYDIIRAKNKGIGIARLEGGTCGSCRLKIASVELDRIRSLGAEAVVTCEECGALLAR